MESTDKITFRLYRNKTAFAPSDAWSDYITEHELDREPNWTKKDKLVVLFPESDVASRGAVADMAVREINLWRTPGTNTRPTNTGHIFSCASGFKL